MDGVERRRIARAISAAENRGPDCAAVLRAAYGAPGRARIIALTGPPGAGKSTLADRLAGHLARQGRRVAILAIDPSSPFSGGALLGDRIRQGESAAEGGVFFRSVAARGTVGGLSGTAVDILAVLAGAGFDDILLETVGAGQSDVEVGAIADCTLVLAVPGLGDAVQAAKAGLMEIADVFVVNKADLAGAAETARALRAAVAAAYRGRPGLNPGAAGRPAPPLPASPGAQALVRRHGAAGGEAAAWVPPVLAVAATRGEGIAEVAAAAGTYLDWFAATGREDARRRDRLYHQILRTLSALVMAPFAPAPGRPAPPPAVAAWVERIERGEASPLDAARALAPPGAAPRPPPGREGG